MRWDLVSDSNPELKWTKKLVALRKSHPALQIGDYLGLDTDRLIGFTRRTDRALDTVVVLANPSDEIVKETISARDGRIMNGGQLRDLLDGSTVQSFAGLIDVTVPAHSARVYEVVSAKGYTPYKRIH